MARREGGGKRAKGTRDEGGKLEAQERVQPSDRRAPFRATKWRIGLRLTSLDASPSNQTTGGYRY